MLLGLQSVAKTYHGNHASDRVNFLQNIYKLLRDKQVPHVDRLTHVIGTTIYLEPKGIFISPSSEEELLNALVCILQALQVGYHILRKLTLTLLSHVTGSSPRSTSVP